MANYDDLRVEREAGIETYTVTTAWITPPENQGQVVVVSYALDQDAGVILECAYDGSDRSTTYSAYAYPESDDDDWDLQNGRPELGAALGECKVMENAEGNEVVDPDVDFSDIPEITREQMQSGRFRL